MTVLVSDSFNRANGALGSTDSYNGGTSLAWQTSTANFIISNNKGSVSVLDDAQYAYVDPGQSNVTITVDMSQNSTLSKCPKLFFRANDFTNGYVVYWNTSWKLDKLVNGAFSNLATSSIVGVDSSTVTVKVVCNANSISWYLNGTLASTITDSTFAGTKHGWGSQRVNGFVDNFVVEDLNTGGTGTTINAVLANANASSLTPTVSAQKQVSVSSVVANATANSLNPSISASSNITSVVGSATAASLSPQVGSFTNVIINVITTNATASANVPTTQTIRNINLGAPIPNTVASALIPNVGLSKSVNIPAVIASLMVDGIAPSISTAKGQTDTIIRGIVAGLQAVGIVPNINGKVIIGTIHLKGSQKLNVYLVGSQKLNVNLKGSQELNVHLKGGIS